MGQLRSQKQEREQLVRSLRASGKPWVEVAEGLRQHYRVNARVALRYAHLDHNRSKQSILVWVWICVGALRVVEGRL